MAKKCNTTNRQPNKKPTKVDLSKKSQVRKRIQEHRARLRAFRAATADERLAQAQAEAITQREIQAEWIGTALDMPSLDTMDNLKLQDHLAALFNIRAKNLIDADLYGNTAGEIRYALAQRGRQAQNLITAAAQYAAVPRIKEARRAWRQFLDSAGVKISTQERDELLVDLAELGGRAHDDAVYGVTPAAKWLADQRYDRFVQRLQGLGINPDMDVLLKYVEPIHSAFDEVRLIANSAGVDVGKVGGIDYFHRTMQDTYGMVFRERYVDKVAGRYGDAIAASKVRQSRNTYHMIPEDWEAFMSFPSVSKSGATPESIMDMLTNDPIAARKWFHETLTDTELETLADTGVLAKLPMTTREVSEYFDELYQLPFKGVTEKFKTNPLEALDDYAKSLERATKEGAMATLLHSDMAQKQGWSLTADAYQKLSEAEKKHFVRANVSAERFSLERILGKDGAAKLGQYYVHTRVEKQWSSHMRVSTNPSEMGMVANYIHAVMRNINLAALLSGGTEFLTKFVGGNVIQGLAAGAELSHILPRHWEFSRVMKQGLDSLDDTVPRYIVGGVEYTQRGITEEFFKRVGGDFASHMGSDLESLDPRNFTKALRDIQAYSASFGDPLTATMKGASYAGKLADKAVRGAFTPLARVAAFNEMSMKYAVWTSLFEKADRVADAASVANRFHHVRFNNFDEATRHVDEYFVNYHTTGEVPASLGKFVVPFASYVLLNPGMVFRHVMRKPQLYINYLRAQQKLGCINGACDKNITEDGFTEDELDKFAVAVGRDARTNRLYFLYPGNYDPYVDAFDFAVGGTRTLMRLAGWQDTGNKAGDTRVKVEGFSPFDVTKGLANDYTSPVLKIGAELMTGKDLFTGRDLDTETEFLGVKLPPVLAYAARTYPVTSAIEGRRGTLGKLLNNSPLTEVDEYGNTVRQGNREMTDSEKKRLRAATEESWVTQAMYAAGLKVRVLDIDEGEQRTLSDLFRYQRDLTRKIDARNTELSEKRVQGRLTDTEKREYTQLVSTLYNLNMDIARIKQWMSAKGVPEKQVLNQLREMRIKSGLLIRDLPSLNEEAAQQEATRYYRKYLEGLTDDDS